jgi:hypothetical protein
VVVTSSKSVKMRVKNGLEENKNGKEAERGTK